MTEYEGWAIAISLLALLLSIGSMLLSWHEHEKRLDHEETWRREDREHEAKERREQAKREARADFEHRLQRFLDCMAGHEGRGGLTESLDCGLALFKSDDEIRAVHEARRKSNAASNGVFGNLERDFGGKDTKAILDRWQSMSEEERRRSGGISAFVRDWPKKEWE